ncbi:MAG: hypothetical protein VB878_19850, partial [Pirellulaceae bacterium]
MLYPRRRGLLTLCALAVVITSSASARAEGTASAEKSFSVVLLPDTQNYSEKYPDTYVAQTLWIRKRVEEDN